MHKFISSVLLTAMITCVNGQDNWLKIKVGDIVSVMFPALPVFKTLNNQDIYTVTHEGCTFIANVDHDAIPGYSEFVKRSREDRKKTLDILLYGTIQGIFVTSGNDGSPFTGFEIGQYSGIEASYRANYSNGVRTTRHVCLFYALNTRYVFDVFPLQDDSTCVAKKEVFFNSIKVMEILPKNGIISIR